MPFNGSGIYSPSAADFPAVAGTLILSTKFNNNINDIATALSNCVTRDGQSPPTANLPMGGFKFTNVADGTSRVSPVANFASLGQVQDGGVWWGGTAGGTADALTLTMTPAIPAYVAGQRFVAKSGASPNTGPATLAVSGLAAKAIQRNGAALAAGEIPASLWFEFLYDGAAFQISPFGDSPAQIFSGVVTVIDTNFSILGSADATKKLRFEVDTNIPTGSTLSVTPGQGQILPAGIGPLPYAGSTVPSGWLECNGASLLRTDYPALFTAIGTTWGSVDGTHFTLPDMRGRVAICDGTGTVTETITSQTAAGNAIPVASNDTKWITGMTVVVSGTTGFGGTGLANGTHFVIRVDSTHLSFATTLANAQNGTAETLTGTGSAVLTTTWTARTLGQNGGEEAHAMSSTEQLLHTHIQTAHNHTYLATGAAGAGPGAAAPNANATLNTGNTTAVNQNTGGNASMNIIQPFIVTKYIISY